MKKSYNNSSIEDINDWESYIGSTTKNSQNLNQFFNDQPNLNMNFKRNHQLEIFQSPYLSFQYNLKNLIQTYDSPAFQEEQFQNFNKTSNILQKTQDKTQNTRKGAKYQKSSLYSKSYRQKKKQYVKSLQEENSFLKKKVDQLHMRLRQKQIELNRIKFSSNKQQFNIQKINEEFMKKLALISNQKEDQTKGLNQVQYITNQKKMQQFVNFYQIHGLGGTKTRQLLGYYSNEFLQNVMRDRQKYLFFKFMFKKPNVQQKSTIDIALSEAFQPNQEEYKSVLKLVGYIRPVVIELKDSCREFYKSYRKVIESLQKLQDISKIHLSQDIEITKKRLKMVMWFQNNQYRKQMRNLRAEWMNVIKSEQQEESIQLNQIKKKIIV